MRSSFLFLFLLIVAESTFAQFGKISGKVISSKTGEALIGATLTLKEKSKSIKSDQNGGYSFGNLTPGNYTIICTYVSYKSNTLSNINVLSNDVATQDFIMEEAGKLDAVVIKSSSGTKARETVSALLIAQKNRASVSDGISQETIKKTPDRSVSDVLKRVTGASIQDEKFVIVRGLNDRYNASFLNGAALPSSEDSRKAFAFNIFPANAIDNLVIQKTATPDMPAEFAGGLINIETKSIPTQNFNSFSFGLGYNTISTFKDRQYYRGGRWDFLGIDNGVRALPESFPDPVKYNTLDTRSLITASQSFTNLWKVYNGINIPNINMQYSMGRNIQRHQKDFLGFLLSATYSRNYTNTIGQVNSYDLDFSGIEGQYGLLQLTRLFPYQIQSTSNSLFGLMANFSLKLNNNNNLSFKNVLSINGEDKVIYREGFESVLGAPDLYSKSTFLWFTSNRVLSNQLIGEHYLPKTKIKLNWLASYTDSDREMPSLRTMKYRTQAGGPYKAAIGAYTNEGAGNILFFNNKEGVKNVKFDLSRSFKIARVIQNQFKAGFYYQTRNKNFYSRKLNYNKYTSNGVSFDQNLLILPQDKIFDPKNMGTRVVSGVVKGGFYIDDATQPEDTYNGFSELYAYYGMMDQRFGKHVRLIYGVRIEDFHLLFKSARLGAVEPLLVNSRKQDLLPSGNIVFSIGTKQNVRLSYSQTINRPEFLELAPFLFYDYSTRLLVNGRETNKRALIENFDARYEFFPGKAQMISFSAFHKKFTDPIELRFLNGVTDQAEYVNLPMAEVTGGECEVRTVIGSLIGAPEKSLINKFTIYGNYTFMNSKLTLTTDPTQKRLQSSRPMQGQSPYVFNAGLNYQDENSGLSSTLSVNETGPRIYISGNGQDGDYDILEAPRKVIDLQVSKNFTKRNIELKLNIKDILAQKRNLFYDVNNNQKFETEKDPVLSSNNFGRVISVSLSYKF